MKLIRDGIPEFAAAGGMPLSFHLASPTGRVALLRDKLIEEANEFLAAGPGERAEELADLLEVIAALVSTTAALLVSLASPPMTATSTSLITPRHADW
jgi:predicted house-cleaning noncanonical NTP pyrophosphatase (MazG superfamily)